MKLYHKELLKKTEWIKLSCDFFYSYGKDIEILKEIEPPKKKNIFDFFKNMF